MLTTIPIPMIMSIPMSMRICTSMAIATTILMNIPMTAAVIAIAVRAAVSIPPWKN